MLKIGCTYCPYNRECVDAYKEVAQYCGHYDNELTEEELARQRELIRKNYEMQFGENWH